LTGAARLRSCEYDARPTSVGERLRQLARVRPARGKPLVVLVPPPPPPPAPDRPSSDKVPRYNDTGSFEEVDERLLMLDACCVACCNNSVHQVNNNNNNNNKHICIAPQGRNLNSETLVHCYNTLVYYRVPLLGIHAIPHFCSSASQCLYSASTLF